MPTEIKVPALGESVTEATVANWFKQEGDAVAQDEVLCELETDKVTLEVNAPAGGTLQQIKAGKGTTVQIGDLLGVIAEGAAAAKPASAPTATPAVSAPAAKPAAAPAPSQGTRPEAQGTDKSGPAARKLADEKGISLASVQGTGKDGRATKGDVLSASPTSGGTITQGTRHQAQGTSPREERVKMSKLRATIARRLKESQNTAAILTTFNEIDMSGIMALRNEYKDVFEKKHGLKLGFMGLFVKAAVHALKEIPAVNAEINGDEIIYKNHYDIGVAVGTSQGLVVPVVRDADQLSLAEIEQEIARLAVKARDGTLSIADMSGGTFTISNGGVYGSLMSTPIINPPQSGILGMHKIEERPMAIKGQVVIRPMMYVALSYDHRIIDGRESVTFLVAIKNIIEDPRRLLLGL